MDVSSYLHLLLLSVQKNRCTHYSFPSVSLLSLSFLSSHLFKAHIKIGGIYGVLTMKFCSLIISSCSSGKIVLFSLKFWGCLWMEEKNLENSSEFVRRKGQIGEHPKRPSQRNNICFQRRLSPGKIQLISPFLSLECGVN